MMDFGEALKALKDGKAVFNKQVENQNNDYLTTDKTISMDKDLIQKGLQ